MQCEYVPSTDGDAVGALFEAYVSSVHGSSANDVRSIVLPLSESTRERLAWFCLSREHLKEIGREIAATCFEFVPSDGTLLPREDMKARSRAEWAYHQD
jgi:hypothetical protein